MRTSVLTSLTLASLLLLSLACMVPLAGCEGNVTPPWPTPTPTITPARVPPVQTTVLPAPTGFLTPVPVTPEEPVTRPTAIQPPTPVPTPALVLLEEKNLVFVYNRTRFQYTLENPPLLIDYSLTVPNISKTAIVTDAVTGNDKRITITYPDPDARFEVTVTDLETNWIVAHEGYGGGKYDVSTRKKLWIRQPGTYYIDFLGDRLKAQVGFFGPGKA